MSTILQDMMGMLKRNGTVTPKSDNYITVARYPNPQERLKPQPKLQTELVTLSSLKTYFNTGGTASLPLTGGTLSGDLTIDGALTLKATNSGGFGSFGVLNTEGGTGAILVNGTLNITGDIVQQGTNASITLTSPTAAIYMTSPDGTVYKVQMANGGTFDITEV
jgi:hypothetical protein